jgi:hypothetical protein
MKSSQGFPSNQAILPANSHHLSGEGWDTLKKTELD